MAEKPETELIRQIREYLRLRGAVTTRVNSGMTVIEGERGRRMIRGAEAGTADILVCFNGRYVAIECKVGDNKPTKLQNEFLSSVREAGGIAFAAWSIEDVDRELDLEPYR